jgi:MSHA biogenesis protein MshO
MSAPAFRAGPCLVPAPAGAAAERGVTLVELITVLTLLAVIASVGARMMAAPVASAVGAGAAVAFADTLPLATRRLAEDLAGALPNSVRIAAAGGGGAALELVPLQSVGRYRIRAAASGSAGDRLDFGDPADDRFDVIGPMPAVPAGAQLVIHNLGTTDADVYAGNNRRAGAFVSGGQIVFTPTGAPFPLESPSGRFALVSTAVTWLCRPAADGSGTLLRYDGYPIQAAQPADPAAAPLAGRTPTVHARGVTACGFTQDAVQASTGLVGARLTVADGEARATLVRHIVLDQSP